MPENMGLIAPNDTVLWNWGDCMSVMCVNISHCLFVVCWMEICNRSLESHLRELESTRVLANDLIDMQAIVNKMGEKMLWAHCPTSTPIAADYRYHRISRMATSNGRGLGRGVQVCVRSHP
jgi:hypothetical protein